MPKRRPAPASRRALSMWSRSGFLPAWSTHWCPWAARTAVFKTFAAELRVASRGQQNTCDCCVIALFLMYVVVAAASGEQQETADREWLRLKAVHPRDSPTGVVFRNRVAGSYTACVAADLQGSRASTSTRTTVRGLGGRGTTPRA